MLFLSSGKVDGAVIEALIIGGAMIAYYLPKLVLPLRMEFYNDFVRVSRGGKDRLIPYDSIGGVVGEHRSYMGVSSKRPTRIRFIVRGEERALKVPSAWGRYDVPMNKELHSDLYQWLRHKTKAQTVE